MVDENSGEIELTMDENIPTVSISPDGMVVTNTKKKGETLSKYYYSTDTNEAIMILISEFIKKLQENKSLVDEYGFKVIGAIYKSSLTSYSAYYNGNNPVNIIFTFEGITLNLGLHQWNNGSYIQNRIIISSNDKSKHAGSYIYDKLLEASLAESDLKGSYFSMPNDTLQWNLDKLNDCDFKDIFLPETLEDDLKLFGDIYKSDDNLLRYLMVGNPGMGKTESIRVLVSLLNKKGVTVIKTNVCKLITKKFKLAEALAPSVVILDDLDLSLGSRSGGGVSPNLQSFLDVLDGVNKIKDGVGILATTNCADLLDMAAQRPGRFDKILVFDDISKKNIKGIIHKSLKNNFNINKNTKLAKEYASDEVVEFLHKNGVTGAHIYNSVNILQLKAKSRNVKVNSKWVIKAITDDIDTLTKLRKTSFLKDKVERKGKSLGYN